MHTKQIHFLKKILGVLLWCVISIIAFLLLIFILIQVPAFQNYAKDKAIIYLENKIKTKVSLDRIDINFPKKIVLEGFYFEDQEKDTLLIGKRLEADIDLFKLLNSELQVNSVSLQNASANISKNKDDVFNFDYIIKAFESKQPTDPNSKPFTISVVKVNLENVNFNFKDNYSRNDIHVIIAHFDTKFKKFELDKMDFNIPTIDLNGLKLVLNQDIVERIAKVSAETMDTISKRKDFKLKLGTISLSNIDISYDNKDSKLGTGLVLGNLELSVNKIDLNKQLLDFETFELKNLKGNLKLGVNDKQFKSPNIDSTGTANIRWKVKLNTVDLQNIVFKFDDMHYKPISKGIDYRHLDLDKLYFKAAKLYYSNDTISGNIKSLAAIEKSGLQIQALKTDFFYGPKSAYLKNLYLKTPQTLLQNNIKVGYPSIAVLQKNIENLTLEANLNHAKIGFKDILLFAPDLQKENLFKSNPNAVLYLNARLNGKIKDLTIPQFEMSGIGNTSVTVSGKITGLPDYLKANYDLNIKKFSSTSKDVLSFVPTGIIPNSIQLPSQINVAGKFNGSIENFKTNLALNSSFGDAKVDALYDQRIKNHEKYKATVYLLDFDLGSLIKNDSLGKITLSANLKGKGLDPKTAQAELDGIVQKAVFNKYVYKNLTLKGNIKNGLFAVKSAIKDPNLAFNLSANGNAKDKYPSTQLKLNLDIADLQKLNLHAGPMKLRGNIDADIVNSDPDYLNGKIFFSNIQVLQEADVIVLDSIKIVAFADNKKNNIKINSQFLKAEVDGKYKLTTLAAALKKTLSQYIELGNSKNKAAADEQRLDFKLYVDNDPILFKIFPKLTGLEPINIAGKYNNVSDSLIVKGTIPRIVYDKNTIADGKINIETKGKVLDYQLSVATFESGQIKVPYTSLSGKVENNRLSYALEVKDSKEKKQYFIAGELLHADIKNTLKINAENLVLNYDKWNINAENAIEFGDKRLYIDKFYLDHSGNELKIQSQGNQNNAPLKVDFVNFKIETILNIIKKDKLMMQGLINGTALIENAMTKPTFTSDLKIDGFVFNEEAVGDILLKVESKTYNLLSTNVTLSGEGNDVSLDGTYKIDDSSFDLKLDMTKLNIKSIQGFSLGQIADGAGFLSGNFKITGNIDAPKLNGDLHFNDAGFRITKIDSYFKTSNKNVSFQNETIAFDHFNFYDENQNELSLNGTVHSADFRNYDFGLSIVANNFRAIHSKEADNDLFYGDLILDTNLNLKGTIYNPIVSGNIRINEDTKFTIVLPQSDPSIADREGIVEFVNEDNLYLKQTASLEKKLNQSALIGMDVSVAISIDKKAELTLVIDKGNGDYLNLKGEAQLTGGIDPSGKTTLTGKYEFSDGAYEMNFNMIRRKFDIQKGSYIVWNGEPTMATLNINAIYKVSAAPIDLLGNQLGAVSQTVKNTYKQKIPFQTILKMNGELMKPEITFDIILPDGNYGVASDIVTASQAKLEQLRQEPAELNKQVFALLLLNRFIGENPFASESGGTSAESLARQSVSKILSQQLNDLAGDLISGVQLNFDLQSTENYTSGAKENRTDLKVGISKKLFDDRIKVTVGSSFGVEGQERANENASNIAGDVALDYQLTKDGRYMIRVYRKNEYQVAIAGQIVETGIAFIVTMSYNKFSELFHRTEEEKEIIKKEKIRKEKTKLKLEKEKQENLDKELIEDNDQ
ncbi:translocation/assembly module TamB domain-containing protein [Flavobacterium cellulosilyticum]|uniref:Translocation/assembly module TamB n=1 Tax=Flavobacterium cellulosilyticum TaxID=2541731 RepID=A0A4R5CJJ8_9FLAO|nr:translocation/assembly module TamB [Flavobacterium cellulosilyticum]TDD98770.1 translocation/assembly module TamB [Flavobacterium cellulosilyticum]